jgi:hypothetical protein
MCVCVCVCVHLPYTIKNKTCVILFLFKRCMDPKMKDCILFIVYVQLKLTSLLSNFGLMFFFSKNYHLFS